jgi:hypothetical protein
MESLALGMFLLGLGVGGVLVHIREAGLRTQMSKELETTLFGGVRGCRSAKISVGIDELLE